MDFSYYSIVSLGFSGNLTFEGDLKNIFQELNASTSSLNLLTGINGFG